MASLIGLIVAILTILASGSAANADEFRSRNEFDLGYTDNAYLTKDEKKADAYLYGSTSNTWQKGDNQWLLRLSYRDYFVEKPNNVLGWRAGDNFKWKDWNWTAALTGQNYTNGSPGTTDNSYDNFGADFQGETESELSAVTNLFYGGGLRFRNYSEMSGRMDHTAFASLRTEWQGSKRLTVGADGELGLLASSLSDYSRLYYDLAGTLDYNFADKWSWTSELSLGQSFFLNRTVSTSVSAVNRRGIRVLTTNTARERYTNWLVSTRALCRQNEWLRWGAEVNSTTQTSLSGFEDYSALTVMARAIFIL